MSLKGKTSLYVCLWLVTGGFSRSARAAFPIEAELSAHLHAGMTTAEVVAQFGPPRSRNETRREANFHYYPPIQLLTNEQPG